MDGMLETARLQVGRLTAAQWRRVERELEVCLEEHRISTTDYLAAMIEIRFLSNQPAPVVEGHALPRSHAGA